MRETTADVFMGWVKCLEEIETPRGHVNAFAFAAEHGLAYWMTAALENASTREADSEFISMVQTYADKEGIDVECKRICNVWLAQHAISMVIKKQAHKCTIHGRGLSVGAGQV